MFMCIRMVYEYKLLYHFFLSFMSHSAAWWSLRIFVIGRRSLKLEIERQRERERKDDIRYIRDLISRNTYISERLRFTIRALPVQPEVDGHGHWRQSCEACKRRLGVSAENELFQWVINAAVKVDRCEGMKKGTRWSKGY